MNNYEQFINWMETINLYMVYDNPMDVDIFFPEKNIAIEYHYIEEDSELSKKDKKYHLNKTIFYENLDIQLLHVFDNEWSYKKDLVKSIIMNKLGKTENRIFARKCKIQEVCNKDKNIFLENNHIQGNDKSSLKVGLYYNNELVSLITFCKSRFNKNYKWEISRFCNKLNTTVVGGFSKLFKYFIRNYKPTSVITYADRRYSEGDLYQKNGFTFSHNSSPNYFYFKVGYDVLYSRNKFQKHKLEKILDKYDPNLTEIQNMNINKYSRIWDCGNKVFVYD